MKKKGYHHAIWWIVAMTDTGWVEELDSSTTIEALLVAELFNDDEVKVRADIIKERIKQRV